MNGVHPDIRELVDILQNASDDVQENLDNMTAEGLEIDITRLNYTVADMDTEILLLKNDVKNLMEDNIEAYRAVRTQRWTVDILCLAVLGLAALELGRSAGWV